MDYIVNIHVWSLPEKTLAIWKFYFMIFINAELPHANIWRMAPITNILAAASSHIGDPTEKLLPQFDPLIHGVQRTGGDLRCAELWHHLCGENCRQPMRHECAMRHENMAHHKNWVEVKFFGFPAPSCRCRILGGQENVSISSTFGFWLVWGPCDYHRRLSGTKIVQCDP